MRLIYKFPIAYIDRQEVFIPTGYKILTVKNQKGIICIWALVDVNAPSECVKIRIISTGQPIEDSDKLEYIGTVQLAFGDVVYHIFRELEV